MPEKATVETPDGRWRLELDAFMISAFVYKAAGATLRSYRWNDTDIPVPIFGDMVRRGWLGSPVDFLSVRVSYEGMFVTGLAGNGTRFNSTQGSHECDDRLWAIGFSLSWDAGGSVGGPSGTPSPGGNAKLDVRGVRARGTAVIEGRQIELPVVSAGIITVNPEVPF